ncbi:MAG: SagB family peptide dehydrogenase [Candidatus Lokiarchaeota archaeon]|nr:SagB family peptide dehydrogenase [Candidatus Lokiarchaeota archaeon]
MSEQNHKRKMEYRIHLKNFVETEPADMQKGIPAPPIEKSYPEGAKLIDLVNPKDFKIGENVKLVEAINNRQSRRFFTGEAISLEELSFLLWCTQGIKKILPNGVNSFRTVPSGGALHPFETYIAIFQVIGIEPGVYRYLPIEHKLLPIIQNKPDLIPIIKNLLHGQNLVNKAAVVYIWAARPARTEWKYGRDSLKDILLSAGHICQNLYLACEAIPAGTCAIVAYDQDGMDEFLGINGYDEISLYTAPVGKVRSDADKLEKKFRKVHDLFQNKKYNDCLIPLNEIVRYMPDNGEAWIFLGYCHLYLGQKEKAREVFEKALIIDPTDINCMYNLSCVLAALGNAEESIRWLKKAIEGNARYKDYAKDDEDFKNIRDSEEFKQLFN